MHDSRYPRAPGHRGIDTSIMAAADIAASLGRMQSLVLTAVMSAGPHGVTTNEAAAQLRLDRGTVQPRTSELRRFGLIRDSGQRRLNANGKKAIVWISSHIKQDLPLARREQHASTAAGAFLSGEGDDL